jgi:hypothetical protein
MSPAPDYTDYRLSRAPIHESATRLCNGIGLVRLLEEQTLRNCKRRLEIIAGCIYRSESAEAHDGIERPLPTVDAIAQRDSLNTTST